MILLDYKLYKMLLYYVTYNKQVGDSKMLDKVTASEARQNFSDILNRAAFGRERVIIHRGKKPVAAIIPIEDYNFLEQLEDRIDTREARKRLNEPTVPWTKIKKDLGL
jgi:prevent-host-death family protein